MYRAKQQELEARFSWERVRFSEDAAVGVAVLVNGSLQIAQEAGVVGNEIAIKGNWESSELRPGMTYRFYGRFQEYRGGQQFNFTSFVDVAAHDEEGVIAYIEAAGKGSGVGVGTARKAWDLWGSDAVRTIRENPNALLRVNNRLTSREIDQIGSKLNAQKATEDAMIELTNLLHGRGFSKKLPRKLIKEFGNRASRVIRKDWMLLGFAPGCGFKRCDQFYAELGYRPERLKRQAMAAAYAVQENSTGDVWVPVEKILSAIRAAIGGVHADPERAIEFCLRLGNISPRHFGSLAAVKTSGIKGPLSEFGDRRWIAERSKSDQELRLAELIAGAWQEDRPMSIVEYGSVELEEVAMVDHVRCNRCSRELTAPQVHIWNGKPFGPTCIMSISDGEDVSIVELSEWMDSHTIVRKIRKDRPTGRIDLPQYSLWPEVSSLELYPHQIEQLGEATSGGRIAILGGSPGTGKTHSVAQLVKAILRSGKVGLDDIAVGAPTGKAAVRVTENLFANGISLRARTWHSLLGAGVDKETGQFGFWFNRTNAWKYKIIIGDEESMKDQALMCAVLEARAYGCHVLLVGDVNQLPPVGSGAPLRDMILAGLPYGQLTEIVRNDGGIVSACAAIRDGHRWQPVGNLEFHEVSSPDAQLAAIEQAIEEVAAQGLDPVWDVQVAVAVNLRSDVSRYQVNRYLQPILNSNPAIAGCPFRVADKIICTTNGWYPLFDKGSASGLDDAMVDDGRVYVANGELAKVLGIEPKRMIAELYSPDRKIVIPLGQRDEGESSEENGSGCNFDLAYAITAHRSQGSEWPVFIVVIDEYSGARMSCDKTWLYTCISRGRERVRLIGQKSTADAMCRRDHISRRKTFLRERILIQVASKALEAI